MEILIVIVAVIFGGLAVYIYTKKSSSSGTTGLKGSGGATTKQKQ